jgi:hypothetical protein
MKKIYKVFMLALKGSINNIREVEVPIQEVAHKDVDSVLEAIFRYGQNDFQPKNVRSVSVGDVIELVTPTSDYKGVYYAVGGMGFVKIESPEHAPDEFELMFGKPISEIRDEQINKLIDKNDQSTTG